MNQENRIEHFKFLFYLGHPAHFHLFRYVIAGLRGRGHEVRILVKKKDVLEQLLQDCGWGYVNILPQGRKDNKLSIAWGMLKRDMALWSYTSTFRPHLMAGTSVEIAHVGRLRGISAIAVNEDDWDVVPLFSKTVYPFCSHILAPDCCRTGKWEGKTIHYAGYHELAYLHPDYFHPDENVVHHLYDERRRFYLLRFAKLTAHHDAGISGLHSELVEKIIQMLEPHGKIYITSERPLETQFEKYRISIAPLDMHHALAFADIYIGDSQTMTAEAAVLGTPALRYNDFVGRIGYLEELEHRYQLAQGFKTGRAHDLLQALEYLLNKPARKKAWQDRRRQMLNDKMDVTRYMIDLFEKMAAAAAAPGIVQTATCSKSMQGSNLTQTHIKPNA